MPELPEVQTVISDLNKKIKGDTIVSFWSEWPRAIKNKSLNIFKKEIRGRKILGVRRIGKNIFIDLTGGKTLYIHLKMTGHLLVKSEKLKVKSEGKNYFDEKVNQYIRHKFYLNSKKLTDNKLKSYNKVLEFSDVRKFAKIVLDETQKINSLKEIKALGIDALDKNFTLKKFQAILKKKSHSPIGQILMDQNLIAGIGNIYRSEILFEAKILPERKIESLNKKEIENIFKNIRKTLEKAVKMRGTSDSDYRDTSGAPGKFQKVLKVYRREKQKCKICDTIIKRDILGQRSFFFCPACQK